MIATTVSFNKKSSLIVIPVTIQTDAGILVYKFAVDTGASYTLIELMDYWV